MYSCGWTPRSALTLNPIEGFETTYKHLNMEKRNRKLSWNLKVQIGWIEKPWRKANNVHSATLL
jgi:hypothetical protein